MRSHTARIGADGTFRVKIDQPPRVNGHYRILFCFNNGLVSGDGKHIRFVNRGDIHKSYEFRDGKFQYGD